MLELLREFGISFAKVASAPLRKVKSLDFLNYVSPIELFDKEQLGKFSRELGNDLITPFFKGQNLKIIKDPESGKIIRKITKPNEELARKRQYLAYAAGGYAGANVLGVDPFGITSLLNTAVQAAVHVGIGAAAYRMGGIGRLLGVGYLGLAGVNLLRPGNQVGPY